MDRRSLLTQVSATGSLPAGLAVLGLTLLACASPPGSKDGTTPVTVEYRLASFSSAGALALGGSDGSYGTGGLQLPSCIDGQESETFLYGYPSGRQVSVEVSAKLGFAFKLWQGEVALHEMPADDGLQVAALAAIQLDERRMKKARKFRAKHETCELVVFVEDALADLLPGGTRWDEGVPGGRFPTMDEARAIYQRPGVVVSVVPEALEKTHWRRQMQRWRARDMRWRFRCDAPFRAIMRANYPETYERFQLEDAVQFGLSCSEPPRRPAPPAPTR